METLAVALVPLYARVLCSPGQVTHRVETLAVALVFLYACFPIVKFGT